MSYPFSLPNNIEHKTRVSFSRCTAICKNSYGNYEVRVVKDNSKIQKVEHTALYQSLSNEKQGSLVN